MQVSIISKLKLDSLTIRLDPEYYHPLNIKLINTICKKSYLKIKEIANVTDGIHSSINFDKKSKINLISAKSPKENYFDLSNIGKISKNQDFLNPRTRLKEDDVVISSVGTIGNCAVVTKDILPANSDRHVGIIRIKISDFYPWFLSTFLLSKFGRFQSSRESTGNVQLNLFIYKINEIIVPNCSIAFQKNIEKICLESIQKREISTEKYNLSEIYLLKELGLSNLQPEHKLTFQSNFSESQKVNRLDAEYFQPKYEVILSKIKNYKNGYDVLNNVIKIKDKNYVPNNDKVYKYVELSNITQSGEINGFTESKGKGLPTRARRKITKNDLIISSIEGSLESIALVNDDYDNALCSTGFNVIESEIINSETLLIFFKSIAGQMQLKKGCNGTILTAIGNEEFKKIIIPLIDQKVQKEIKENITQMYKLKKQSKQLLEIAKTGVEKAIEENEEIAMDWMNQEIAKLGIELQ